MKNLTIISGQYAEPQPQRFPSPCMPVSIRTELLNPCKPRPMPIFEPHDCKQIRKFSPASGIGWRCPTSCKVKAGQSDTPMIRSFGPIAKCLEARRSRLRLKNVLLSNHRFYTTLALRKQDRHPRTRRCCLASISKCESQLMEH
jgi:hypothetical protein